MKSFFVLALTVLSFSHSAQAIQLTCKAIDAKKVPVIVTVKDFVKNGVHQSNYAGYLYAIDVVYGDKLVFSSYNGLYQQGSRSFSSASGFSLSQLANDDLSSFYLYLYMRTGMLGLPQEPIFNTLKMQCVNARN